MIRSIVRYASKKAAPIEKLDPLPHFEIAPALGRLPKIVGLKHSDLNFRNHPNFQKSRMQLMVALDLDHRQRADPKGLKSRLLDQNSPDAIRKGDEVAVETIKSRSYPRSSSTIGICKKITRCGYTSSISIESVIMGTTINIQYKVYSPLVRSITILKRAEPNSASNGKLDDASNGNKLDDATGGKLDDASNGKEFADKELK